MVEPQENGRAGKVSEGGEGGTVTLGGGLLFGSAQTGSETGSETGYP